MTFTVMASCNSQAYEDGTSLPELSSLIQGYVEGLPAEIDLRVEFDMAAVAKLWRLLNTIKPVYPYYQLIAENPQNFLEAPDYPYEIFKN